MKFFKVVILLVCFCISSDLVAEIEIDHIVEEVLKENQIPGIAVAVIRDGEPSFCRGYGMQDVAKGMTVTEKTAFFIASNTKAFTSFLIGQLVEEGKLDWDKPLIQYVPELQFFNEELTQQVTLRDLIAHRTGIPRHDALWHLVRDLSEEDLLQCLRYFSPIHPLRTTFLYTNFMYVLAGIMIERVTEHAWEEEVMTRIFKPLGMKHSGIVKESLQIENLAQPYAMVDGKLLKIDFLYPSSTLAASGIYASVADLAKWVEVQLGKRPDLIQNTSLLEMQTIQMPYSSMAPTDAGYGLGWKIDQYKGRKEVHHEGVAQGFCSEISFLPEDGIGLVILTNSSTHGYQAIGNIKKRIYDLLLEGDKKNTNLEKYVGSYYDPLYGTMEITRGPLGIEVKLGKMCMQLVQKEENLFEAQCVQLSYYGINPRISFSFSKNEKGEILQAEVPFEEFRGAPPVLFKRQ